MDSCPSDDLDDQAMETREGRIRRYAQNWYDFRMLQKIPGNDKTDWAKAEHIVDCEDKIKEVVK